MTTTTTFQGMEPGAKSSSRVLRPPGGGSNMSFGTDDEKPVRVNKMASSVFAEPQDPYANRRNNPPGGKPTGVLCGEPSAPLRRRGDHTTNHSVQETATGEEQIIGDTENGADDEGVPEQQAKVSSAEEPSAGLPSGRRNPPGGKSSLILG